jgi:hypothetical protein
MLRTILRKNIETSSFNLLDFIKWDAVRQTLPSFREGCDEYFLFVGDCQAIER